MPSTRTKALHRCAVAALAFLPAASIAAERTATLTGTSLAVDTPCAAEVTVQPDPGLHGSMAMTARADHPEELDRLLADSGDTVRVHTRPGGCWRPFALLGFNPTLHIALRVPPGTPVGIDESGTGSYVLGDIGGPLQTDVSGVAQVQAGGAASLSADLSGSAKLRVTDVAGPVRLDMSGHNEVTIGRVAAPRLDADISGLGSLTVASGSVGQARIGSSGLGTIGIDAVVDRASVDLSGAGRVRFAQVTGALTKQVSGFGSVTVGPPGR